jgi:hypothetical protein
MCIFKSSFGAQTIRAATHAAECEVDRATDGLINTALKISKVIPLKMLLDTHSRGSNISAANEPDMVDRELKEKQRKKRRGFRRWNGVVPEFVISWHFVPIFVALTLRKWKVED